MGHFVLNLVREPNTLVSLCELSFQLLRLANRMQCTPVEFERNYEAKVTAYSSL